MWKKIGKAKYYLIAGSFFLHLRRFIWNSFVRVLKKIDSLFRKMDKLIGFLIRKIIYSKGEVENNKILVRTYDCRYSCNPKYIVEEMLRRDLPLDIVWVGPRKGRIPALPPAVRAVRNGSYSMYHEMATAKVWIDNALNCVWEGMPKKKTQIYLNTWHGSLGIKRLSGGRTWMRRAKRCNKVTDFCITNSRFEEDVFHETFWPDIPYLRYGHARNDILFQNDRSQELRERVCAFFEIDVDTKILLYAPTFRDDGDMAWFDLDLDRIKEDLEERFGGEWCILVRMHYKNVSKKVRIESPWIRNASRYGDMQELLAVADAGITDYSSWAYDYILTGRPLFFVRARSGEV